MQTSSEVETQLANIKVETSSHFVEVTQTSKWRHKFLFVEETCLYYFFKVRVSFKVKMHLSLDVETRL